MSKYGVFSGPYFPAFVFSPKAGKYGPEKTPYLDTFHAVTIMTESILNKVTTVSLKPKNQKDCITVILIKNIANNKTFPKTIFI